MVATGAGVLLRNVVVVIVNLVIMLFYLIGPFMVSGMSWKEPYIALGVVGVWGIYGAIYFLMASKSKGKEVLLSSKPVTAH